MVRAPAYTTPAAELDVRLGGSNLIVMRGPDGKDLPNEASTSKSSKMSGWSLPMPTPRCERSEKPFMTLIVTLEDNGGKTKYTACVRHWTVADRKAHEKMGFHQGWSRCADQLEALVIKS
jgi:uncharacterized protein YndB with AHSA1/START domain